MAIPTESCRSIGRLAGNSFIRAPNRPERCRVGRRQGNKEGKIIFHSASRRERGDSSLASARLGSVSLCRDVQSTKRQRTQRHKDSFKGLQVTRLEDLSPSLSSSPSLTLSLPFTLSPSLSLSPSFMCGHKGGFYVHSETGNIEIRWEGVDYY